MRIIRTLVIALSIGSLSLAVMVFAVDLGFLKPVYERVASHYLKREVRVNGSMSVRMGQTIVASAHDALVMGESAEDTPLASAGVITAHFNWAALWDRTIEIPVLSVSNARLNLRIDETGRDNWPNLKKAETEAQKDGPAQPKFALRIGEARLDRVEILVRNKKNLRDFKAQLHQLDGLSTGNQVTLTSTGTMNGRAYDTQLLLDGVASLLEPGPWRVDWRGQIGRATFDIAGFLAPLKEWRNSLAIATLHTDSANDLLASLSLPLIDDGPVDIRIDLAEREEIAQLALEAKFGEFHFSGTAHTADPLHLRTGAIDLVATGPNLAHLGALTGQANWPETPFEIDLETSRAGTRVDVETLELISDAIRLNLNGSIEDYRALGTGRLRGTVDIPALDVWSDVLNLPPSLSGALTGTVALTGEGRGADVIVSTRGEVLALEIGGRLEPGVSMLGSTLRVSGFTEEPHRLINLFTNIDTTLPPATLQGEVRIEQSEVVRLQDLELTIGQDRIIADGNLGWSNQRYTSEIQVSVESADLNTSLTPWLPRPEVIPALAARVSGTISYPESSLIRVNGGALTSDAGAGQFTGAITFSAEKPAISGDWRVAFPAIQPLLATHDLPPDLEKPVTFEGRAAWQPGSISIDDGHLTYGSTDVTGDLFVDMNTTTLEFDLQATTPDLTDYAPDAAGTGSAFSVPIEARLIGELTEEVWSVDTFELASSQAVASGEGYLELDGDEFIDSHIAGTAQLANLAIFSDLIDLPLPEQDLQLDVDLDSRAGALVIDRFKVTSGKSDFSLTGRAANPTDPEITLELRSRMIDIAPWLAAADDTQPLAEGDNPDPAPTPVDRLIPAYPLDLTSLNQFRARTMVSIDELAGLPRPVKNVSGDISAGPGGVTLSDIRAENTRGGGILLNGQLLTSDDGVPQMSVRIEGEEIIFGIPKAPSEDVASLPSYNLKARLSGTGEDTQTIASSLDGYVNVTMGSGKVLNAGLDRVTNSFLQELSRALNPFQEEQESTTINCGAAFAAVHKGQLRGKPAVVVDTPNVKIFADAALDLASGKIQVQFKTVPQKGLGFSMSSLINPYIEVTGTLIKPRLSLNPGNTVVAGSLAVMTGGISVLIRNVMERLGATGSVCAARLRKANEEMTAFESAS